MSDVLDEAGLDKVDRSTTLVAQTTAVREGAPGGRYCVQASRDHGAMTSDAQAVLIRPAVTDDAAAISAIYNEGVTDRVATFETRQRGPEEIEEWFADGLPFLVAERGDDGVVGFARVSPCPDRSVYTGVGEHGVYVARSARGQRIGRQLLVDLATASEQADLYKLTSRVFTDNLSGRLAHLAAGFEEVGIQRRHGKLDGQWKDCVLVERLLGEAAEGPHPPRRPDEAAHQQGLAQFLTPERRQLIDELQQLGYWMGSVQMSQRIGIAAQEGYEHLHITQLLVRKNLKQSEFAEDLAAALLDGRTAVALALTRTLLEGGVELSWAADAQLPGTPEDRLLRILRRGYEALAAVSALPPSERAVLDDAVARGLNLSPNSARNAMQEMDRAEVQAGGSAYWESHYEQFRVSSGYVHTSFVGPARFRVTSEAMEIDMNPDPLEGMSSLRWGLYYFARGADAVLRLVGLDDDVNHVVERYAAVRELADSELDKVMS
jgi:L-amino acid N-acyltransferase YncA